MYKLKQLEGGGKPEGQVRESARELRQTDFDWHCVRDRKECELELEDQKQESFHFPESIKFGQH